MATWTSTPVDLVKRDAQDIGAPCLMARETRKGGLTLKIGLHQAIMDIFVFVVLLDLGMAEAAIELDEPEFDFMPVIEGRVDKRRRVDTEEEDINTNLPC